MAQDNRRLELLGQGKNGRIECGTEIGICYGFSRWNVIAQTKLNTSQSALIGAAYRFATAYSNLIQPGPENDMPWQASRPTNQHEKSGLESIFRVW